MNVVVHNSGEILGFLIRAFGGAEDLPSPLRNVLKDRSARRLFNGKSSRNTCCRLSVFSLMLFERDLVPLPEAIFDGGDQSKRIFSVVLSYETALWDALGRAQPRRAYLRYLAIDMSWRLCGLVDRVALESGLLDAQPAWASSARRAEPLVNWLRSVTPPRSQHGHADELGFPDSTFSGWCRGRTRPSPRAIEVLAKYIRPHDKRGAAFVGKFLHWHYALWDIAQAIEHAEGEAFAVEWVAILTRTLACSATRAMTHEGELHNRFRISALVNPTWRAPDAAREMIFEHAARHGATEEWLRDVQAVCDEFRALGDPNEIFRKHRPRHAHAPWRVPKKWRAQLALTELRSRRGRRKKIAQPKP